MKQYTRTLYANGCSWCQGYLLQEDPVVRTHAEAQGYEFFSEWHLKLRGEFVSDGYQNIYDQFNWAGLLCKQLKIPQLVNHSLGGGSNARILRTTIDYVKTLSRAERNSVLVVIGWTLPDRSELYLETDTGTGQWSPFNAAQSWDQINSAELYSAQRFRSITEYWQQYVLNVHSTYACIKQFFQQSYLLANTLENLGIRYYFFNTFPVYWNVSSTAELREFSADAQHYQQHSAMSLTETFVETLNYRPELLLSDGHPNSAGYLIWADILKTQIQNLKLV